MMKHLLYFFSFACAMYALLVTYTLVDNHQFTHEYRWNWVVALTTSASINVFAYFTERRKKKQ